MSLKAQAGVTNVCTRQYTQVLNKIKQKTKAVVYWGAGHPGEEDKKALKDAKIPLYSFAEFEKLGADKPKDPVPPSPQEPCTIMYTRRVFLHLQAPLEHKLM